MSVKPQEQPQLRAAEVMLTVADAEDHLQQILLNTGDLAHPCHGPSPVLSVFRPPSTSPSCHSKEGTHQPQAKHQGEKKVLSRALLTTRGGTCLLQAWTKTFLPMGTAGLDVSLVLQPGFPRATCQALKHCHGTTGQR